MNCIENRKYKRSRTKKFPEVSFLFFNLNKCHGNYQTVLHHVNECWPFRSIPFVFAHPSIIFELVVSVALFVKDTEMILHFFFYEAWG